MNDRDAVDLLEQIVRIPSVSGSEQAVAQFIVRTFEQHGIPARVDAFGNTIAELAGVGPRIVLLGHMDTVPGDIPVRWEDGRLFGRGSVDAKGPLVAFMAAMFRLAKVEQRPSITFVGCVEEEVASSKGAHGIANTLPAPDSCIVGEPSGWDGITLGYKGFLQARVRCASEHAHSAHAVRTAADQICRAWMSVSEATEEWNAQHPALFDQLLPNLVEVQSRSDGLEDRAELSLKLRLPPALGPQAAVAWLEELLPAPYEVEAQPGVAAWSGPRTTPLHRALSRGILAAGGRPRYQRKTGTADLNIVAPRWNCYALAYGPGDAALDHTPDEHILADEFEKGIGVLTHALVEFSASTDSTAQAT